MKERKRESSRNKSTKGINHSRLPGSVAGVLGWIRSLLSTRPHVPLVRSFPRNQRHVASHREGEGVLFGVRKYLRAVTEPHDRRVTRLPAHRRAPRRNDSQMEPPRPPLRASADPFRTRCMHRFYDHRFHYRKSVRLWPPTLHFEFCKVLSFFFFWNETRKRRYW